MFGYIIGKVTEVFIDYAIIESQGVGFKLTTSQFTNEKLVLGESAKLYTKLNVREDDISLFGFWDREEMKMFELLTSVSKIGPKVGFSILSTHHFKNLPAIIARADVTSLSKAAGVGKRTAERIIVELKDKVEVASSNQGQQIVERFLNTDYDEAIEVLVSLGFSKAEASQAVETAMKQPGPKTTNDLVKLALASLSKI